MFQVIPIPAFRDNYIWLLRREEHAVVVDPGDAAPVLAYLDAHGLALDAILVTHHHNDHIGGIDALLARHAAAAVYASAHEHYQFKHQAVREGDEITLRGLQSTFQVMETPGHTLGHIVYYGANHLFCGDTLFSCGCGRLFDGTCQQLFQSLNRIANLPGPTLVYCTHEYTLQNCRFALSVDPSNLALQQRYQQVLSLDAQHRPTLPSTIAQELATNPFLRCDTEVILRHTNTRSAEAAFCALRYERNSF